MGQIWFTSDPHLGHHQVAQLRGFTTTEAHDRAILVNLRRRVRPGDTLFLLGDLVMGSNKEAHLDALAALPCDVHVVLGNHDRTHPGNGNSHHHLSPWTQRFASVQTSAAVRHRGATILLSHFPYDGEGQRDLADRYTQWRLRDEGATLLHGHVHDPTRHRLSTRGTPMIHVGLDAWALAPVTLHDALAAADPPQAAPGRGVRTVNRP